MWSLNTLAQINGWICIANLIAWRLTGLPGFGYLTFAFLGLYAYFAEKASH